MTNLCDLETAQSSRDKSSQQRDLSIGWFIHSMLSYVAQYKETKDE